MDSIESYVKKSVGQFDLPKSKKDELKIEFADHISSLRDEYLSRGFSEAEAIALAIKNFGNDNKISSMFNAKINKSIRIFSLILFIAYLIPLLLRLNYLSIFEPKADHFMLYNLVPFYTLTNIIKTIYLYGLSVNYIDMFSTILWFIPVGILVPLAWNTLNSLKNTFKIYIILILIIHLAKFILLIGNANIDFAIIYLLGCMIGYLLIVNISKVNVIKKFLYYDSADL